MIIPEGIERVEKTVIITSGVFTALVILMLILVRWPQWWEFVIPEMSPLSFLETFLLIAVALTGLWAAILCYLKKDMKSFKLWIVFGLGFIYLSADENLAIHEQVRSEIILPNHIKIPLFFWAREGDFIMLSLLIIGLLLGVRLYRIFRERKLACRFFILGMFFSVTAVLLDSFSYDDYGIDIRLLEQFGEEIIETAGMLSFFNASFLMASHYLCKIMSTNNSETCDGHSEEENVP